MGLSSSKAHPKVTRVAPVPTRGDVSTLSALQGLSREPGQPSPHPSVPIFQLELPPLRETWYGRASAGEGALLELCELGLGVCWVWGGLCCSSSFVPFLPFPGCFHFGRTHFSSSTVLESVLLSRAAGSLLSSGTPCITLAPTHPVQPPWDPLSCPPALSGTSLPHPELDPGQVKLSVGIDASCHSNLSLMTNVPSQGHRKPGSVCFPSSSSSPQPLNSIHTQILPRGSHPSGEDEQLSTRSWRLTNASHSCWGVQGETSMKSNGG